MNLPLRNSKYFDRHISHGLISLFTGKAIMNIASGFFGIFLPIYLYGLFHQDAKYVAFYYLLGSFTYFVFLIFGAKFLNRFGFRRSLRISTLLGATYYLGLYFLKEDNFLFMIPYLVIVLGLYRVLYWVPYHVDFSKFTGKKNRGKDIGMMEATLSIIGVISPVAAGFIISHFSYQILFLLGIIIYLTSLIPYLTIPRTKEKFSWSYKKTWQQFFSKKYRRTILIFMADGAEGAVGGVIWPIFMFNILDGSYLKTGLIATAVIGLTIFLQLTMGRFSDNSARNKSKLLKYGSLFSSLGWVFKIFIGSLGQLFIIDTLHKFSKIVLQIPFDSITYEIAADQGHYIDEFTVLHEMAISLGRILMYSVIIGALFYISLSWLFILAAIVSVSFNFLREEGKMINRQS